MKALPKEFATAPIVYAVRDQYQILVPVTCETVMWVKVGDRCFYDDSNGILCSASSTHKMTVPASLLDKEKRYTVCYRVIRERKPYFTDAGEVLTYESRFRPIEHTPTRIYHVADAHNLVDAPIAAGRSAWEELDLLILNGDIPNHSGKIEYFTAIHQIAAGLTGGEIPVVFSRGNHDTRGIYAEKIADHTPTDGGRSYYTFRVGHIWGMVLDCGEDKADGHPEYGYTVCCEDFRRRETAFIRDVIRSKDSEYAAEGVLNRLVICHVPFSAYFEEPFDIEDETYREWCRLLREEIRPQLMLCGHTHEVSVSHPGDERDNRGQPCTVVVASEVDREKQRFLGGAIELRKTGCSVRFTDSDGNVSEAEEIIF